MAATNLQIHLVLSHIKTTIFQLKLPYARLYKKTRETLKLNNQFKVITFQT
jgi:23S rRNA C2498 (ribose-2'-O)-methylase RlmM